MFVLGKKSLQRLDGVHEDLVKVVCEAIKITEVDFCVIEGPRTFEKQKKLLAQGATTTLNSRHLTGHAVDLAAWVDGGIRWDWPLYDNIAVAMKRSALTNNISIEWGGDWKTFKDGPHFQLPWKEYPE